MDIYPRNLQWVWSKFRFAWIYYDPCIPTPIPLWVIYFIFPFTLKGYLKLEICLQKIWNNKIISKIFPLDDAQELIFFQCEEERKLIKSGWLNSDRQKKAKSIELRRGLALSLEIDHFGEVISLVVMEGDIEAEMLAKKMARRMNSIWQNKYLSVVINVVRADLYLAIVGEVEEILFSQGT